MPSSWTVHIATRANHTLSLFRKEAWSEWVSSPQLWWTPKLLSYYDLSRLIKKDLASNPVGCTRHASRKYSNFDLLYAEVTGWRVILYTDGPAHVHVQYLHRIENATFKSVPVSNTIAKMWQDLKLGGKP